MHLFIWKLISKHVLKVNESVFRLFIIHKENCIFHFPTKMCFLLNHSKTVFCDSCLTDKPFVVLCKLVNEPGFMHMIWPLESMVTPLCTSLLFFCYTSICKKYLFVYNILINALSGLPKVNFWSVFVGRSG